MRRNKTSYTTRHGINVAIATPPQRPTKEGSQLRHVFETQSEDCQKVMVAD